MNQLLNDTKILIIEDEEDIATLLKLHLSDVYQEVVHINHGLKGFERAKEEDWDLLILDVRLPGIDGLEVCRRLRAEKRFFPILMLTAKTSELDRVLGLETGADDYMPKPFSIIELMARVKALIRRMQLINTSPKSEAGIIQFSKLVINEYSRQVTLADMPVELTAKEFDLLLHFAKHPNKVFRRSELLDSVWGYGHAGYEHTVNSHINRLRSKIGNDYISTVWGVGYKMSSE